MKKLLVLANKATPFLGLAITLAATRVMALDQPAGVPTGFSDMEQTIRTIFSVIIMVSAIVFVIIFLIGGVQYLTASGNEENAKTARKMLLHAVIGLVIVLAAWGVGTWVISTLTGEEITTTGY